MPVKVTIEDHTGNQSRTANISDTTAMSKLLPAIIAALELPLSDPAGRPITYHLVHNERQLEDNETLSSSGVQAGDTISIVPEMTAGVETPFAVTSAGVCAGVPVEKQAVTPKNGLSEPIARVLFDGEVAGCIREAALSKMRNHAASYRSEGGGLLTSRVNQDRGRFVVLVETSLPSRYIDSDAPRLLFTLQTWVDLWRRRLELEGVAILGWYCSHPRFGVFPPGVDFFSHRCFFDEQPWSVAFVVDPSSGGTGAFTRKRREIVRAAEVAIV